MQISSIVTVTSGSPRVDIETHVVNTARDHRLRVLFPSGCARAAQAQAEQPFDVVSRPIALPDLNDGYPDEKPSPCQPQLTFVDVTDGEAGLMVVNHGLPEYEVADDEVRTVALTLLRCLSRLERGKYSEAADFAIAEAQMQGQYKFRYSVIPHAGTWREAYRCAKEYLYPLQAVVRWSPETAEVLGYPAPGGGRSLPQRHGFVHIDGEDVVVSALKKHEQRDSVVIRLLNMADQAVTTRVRLDVPRQRCTQAFCTNLNEERQAELPVSKDGWVPVTLGAKRIVSLELVLTCTADPADKAPDRSAWLPKGDR